MCILFIIYALHNGDLSSFLTQKLILQYMYIGFKVLVMMLPLFESKESEDMFFMLFNYSVNL